MCDVKNCRSEDIELLYYGHEVCLKCWLKDCQGKIDLKKSLGIVDKPEPTRAKDSKEKQTAIAQFGLKKGGDVK